MFGRTEPLDRRSGGSRIRRVMTIVLIVTVSLGMRFSLVHADNQASSVTWDDRTISIVKSGDQTRGAALAIQCKACHGLSGKSDAGLIPSLAGMNPMTIYKQLDDFRNERRIWRDMTEIARLLSQQDMADLAIYWAAQPGRGKLFTNQGKLGAKLVNQGNDQKGVPACIVCHGSEGNEFGAPSLVGQQRAYIELQLIAFASGLRHNDTDKLMRDIASRLTPEERHDIAVYLSGMTP